MQAIDVRLFAACMESAERLIPGATQMEDGEKCFNLVEFLDGLEYSLETLLDGPFDLDAHQIARFIWCCLTDDPAGCTFRGLPILD